MYYSHFQAKCGRIIMWSHKIQSLWSDLKNHINMTCVTAGTGIEAYGLFFWIIRGNNPNLEFEMFWILALSLTGCVCLSFYVCVKWLFLCLSGCISSIQQININGPSSCLCLGTFSFGLNFVQSAEGKQDCRERARGQRSGQGPLELPMSWTNPGVFSQGN